MEEAKLHEFIREIKEYIFDNFNLNQLSDEELEEQIEELIRVRLQDEYLTIEERVDIVRQVYSSIRGFGLLDTIMYDDSIT